MWTRLVKRDEALRYIRDLQIFGYVRLYHQIPHFLALRHYPAKNKVWPLFRDAHFDPNGSTTFELRRYGERQMGRLNPLPNSYLSCGEYELWSRFDLLAPWLSGSINGRSRVLS